MSPPQPQTTTLTPYLSLSPLLPRRPTLSLHGHSPRVTLTTKTSLNQTTSKHHLLRLRPLKSLDETKQTANTSPEEQSQSQSQSPPRPPEEEGSSAEAVGKEVRRLMEEREREDGTWRWLSGVGEEVREIEWPVFEKVLGTTGVVLAVIAGSSVVLLTVNAVLAELSDRIFAGRGVQDFFT